MISSKNYWKTIKTNNENKCPNLSLFRFLSHLNFPFKNKKILEIGFGHGSDLIHFKKKGSKTYGVDINKQAVKDLKKKIKNIKFLDCGKKKIYFQNTKFDLIFHRDMIYYLNKNEINFFHKNVFLNLKKNGLYVFQYIENDLIKKNKDILEQFDLNIKKNYLKKKIAEKSNPVKYLKFKFLLNNCKKNNLKLLGKKILIESYDINEKKLRINRYMAFKK